jgi:hypothetical protein
MSKVIRRTTAVLALIVLSLAALSQPQRTSSQQSTSAASRNAALIAATAAVLKETSEIRELAVMRPVQSSTQSRPEIERMLIKNLDEEITPAQVHAGEVTLKRLGQVPADFQYRALMLRVLTEQVAGYYDPKTGEFHLADWIDLDGQRPIMAHELTHALQDQHFNLRRFEHWPKGDSDAELAAHSLIEGDATLAMALYVANNPLRALAFLKSMGMMGMQSEELEKAPRAIRETLLFPYQQGTDWTKALYKEAGWNRVSQAFTELPQSSEQILHPEKYFAHEAPVKVTLLDPTSLLNAGWKRLDYDVEGEWGFYLILDEFLKTPPESRRAAAGWAGDRYAVYEGPKGESLFVSLSAWDTENDAREFFDAYAKRTELRYPNADRLRITPPASKPSSAAPADALPSQETRSFSTTQGAVTLELRGNRVAIIEGLAERMNGRELVRSLWAQSSVRP